MSRGKLDALLDRNSISEVLHRYAACVDARDWPRYRSCFTDPVEIDLESWNGAPASSMAVDDWLELVRTGLSGFDSTQHTSSNHLIEIDADRAQATSYLQATHHLDGNQAILGGYYETTLRRTDEGWKIARSRLQITWRQGDQALFAAAVRRWSEATSQ
jgi:3-phenylpropionate/cinnamic acid dioxygenase small subunit